IILINTHEIASIGALGDVTANNLKKLGVNVEIADSDWGTMVARRAKKEPPEQGGWHIFHTTSGGASVYSPPSNFTVDSTCSGAKQSRRDDPLSARDCFAPLAMTSGEGMLRTSDSRHWNPLAIHRLAVPNAVATIAALR